MPTHSTTALATLRQTIFIISIPFYILGLMLPVYGKETGASVVEIGMFFSVFSLMTVILRPLFGWGLDRLRRRGLFLAGLDGYAR
jgi:MFS family permease